MSFRKYSLLLFLTIIATSIFAQDAYQIKVTLDNYDQDELYLGYYFGDKQYIKDTARIDNGTFIFEGDQNLKGGVYLVVMPPDNQFFQLMITGDETAMELKADAKDPSSTMEVSGSLDNELFYNYLHFLSKWRPAAEQVRGKMDGLAADSEAYKKLEQEIESINEKVKKEQSSIVEKYPNTMTAALLKANMMQENIPEFTGTEEAQQIARWHWMKKHYFDNIDMADARMIRTPFLHERINHYTQKLIVQHPDSISAGVDYVLEQLLPAEESFQFYLVHFLNTYAKSNIVGMDAVYVHIAENYYAKGLAPWTDEEQLAKIIDNAKALKPLLIGETAPDIEVKVLDVEATLKAKNVAESEHKKFVLGQSVTLHGIDAPYTVFVIWAPDCGHCKKAMPKLVEFYKDYQSKGVEVMALCHKNYKDTPSCAELLKEQNALDWINVTDPYFRSKYHTIYDVKSTPQVYVLDKNKKIISKRIGVEQLGEVIDQFMKMETTPTE